MLNLVDMDKSSASRENMLIQDYNNQSKMCNREE